MTVNMSSVATATAALLLVAVVGLDLAYLSRWRGARRQDEGRAPGVARLACFLLGSALIPAVLIGPVPRLAEQLLTVHVAQHVLLLDAAAVLLVVGLTPGIIMPPGGAPPPWLKAIGHPVTAVGLYAGSLWMWHLPPLYNAALEHPALHLVQHTQLVAAGLAFWWHVVSPLGLHRTLRGLGVGAYTATTKVLTGILASAITFSSLGAYSFYSSDERIWGLSAVGDQQVGGGILVFEELIAIGAGLTYLFIRMLGESEGDEPSP